MSNFNPATIQTITDKNILNVTLQKPIDIFKSDINQSTSPNGSHYYKIPYDNTIDTNFFYSKINPTGYTARNIFLFGLLHNNIPSIANVTGEIVIEYTNPASTNKIYTIYLIQPDSNQASHVDNYIDKIVSMIKTSDISLQGIVLGDTIPSPGTGCYLYTDLKSNTTLTIFIKPINVSSVSANWFSQLATSTKLFSIAAPIQQPTDTVKPTSPHDKGYVEGEPVNGSDGEIYIDCNPTGESNETIQTCNLPINSELMGQKQQMDFMKTSIHFFIFIIGVMFVYFTVPKIYKKIVIDAVNRYSKDHNLEVENPLTRIRSVDMFLSTIILGGTGAAFYYGFHNDDFNMLSIGLFLIVFFGLSLSLIQSYKLEPDYMTSIYKNCKIGGPYGLDEDTWKYTNFKDFIMLSVWGSFSFFFNNVLKMYLAILIVTAAIIFVICLFTNVPNNTAYSYLVLDAIILAPLTVIIKLLLS